MGFNQALAKLSEEDFQFLMNNGKRTKVLLNHDFESLIYCKWKFLKETLPDLIKKGNFEKLILEIFWDRNVYMFPPDIENIKPNDALSFIFWLKDEMDAISKMEQMNLSSDPDPDLMAAGINEMSQFGDLNVIDQLAGGDVLKWEQIKQLPYHVIFDKQLKALTEARIEKKLAKIKSKPKGR